MNGALRLYRRLLSASWRAVLQYRFSFLISMFFQTLLTVSDFLVVLTILYRTRAIGGWSAAQVGVIYGVTSIACAIYRVLGCELHNFQNYIIRGEYDGILLRPWPSLLVLLGRRVEFFRLGGVLQGLVALLISLHYLGGPRVFGWLYAYLLVLPLCGALIFFSISIATAACAFWFGRVRDLQTLTFYAANYAATYPTSIYPGWLRGLLALVPVSFIGYVPAKFALGLGGSVWYLVLPWLVAGLVLALSLSLWRAGEASYHSSGS